MDWVRFPQIKNGYCVTAQRLAGLRRTDSED